jgi:hypothetical protein
MCNCGICNENVWVVKWAQFNDRYMDIFNTNYNAVNLQQNYYYSYLFSWFFVDYYDESTNLRSHENVICDETAKFHA